MDNKTLLFILGIIFITLAFFEVAFLFYCIYDSSKKQIAKNKTDIINNIDLKIVKTNSDVLDGKNDVELLQAVAQDFEVPIRKEEVKNVFIEYKEPKKKKTGQVFEWIFIVLFLLVIAFSAYSKITNNPIVLGNISYVTIKTGSMSEVYSGNTYVEENNLTDQIDTLALVKLDRVGKNDDIEMYGVYSYKDTNNNLIVHRIIGEEVHNGITYYEFRGDANESSDVFLIPRSDILYKYSGWENVPCGYIVSFLNSTIGNITLLYAIVVIVFIDYLDGRAKKALRKAKLEYIDELNSVQN